MLSLLLAALIIYAIQKNNNIQIPFKVYTSENFYFISLGDIIKIQCWCSVDLARCLIYFQDNWYQVYVYTYEMKRDLLKDTNDIL